MNYIKHLTGFFNSIAREKTLNPTHISLYITIFQCWNINRFKNPFTITRDEIMRGSNIASTATYHKCIKDLQRLGYLEYKPSFNPYTGTLITIQNLQDNTKPKNDDVVASSSNSKQDTTLAYSKNKQLSNRTSSKNEQGSEQATKQVIDQPYIEYNKTIKNITNNINIEREPEVDFLNNSLFLEQQKKVQFSKEVQEQLKTQNDSEKEKSCAKKEKAPLVKQDDPIVDQEDIPSLELVKNYFTFQENTEFEAERFFNYYSSNGWLIGGKSKMKDWKAAARNWILNTSKFASKSSPNGTANRDSRANILHATTEKEYDEPL
ncbi:transcriptional regulator [Flavobacterium sandaracinum]|uniref:Transcriptional regulator n=1 Tax=Flavobacterium sandaracinum TaxID=2541733 RepID=A0A4R5CUB7_9FLAO|nr:transcriptional regulator [Flavobacterium sandaracinum]TDE04272.1 transcriptional regulator [Flavobacterium sandaracinum]